MMCISNQFKIIVSSSNFGLAKDNTKKKLELKLSLDLTDLLSSQLSTDSIFRRFVFSIYHQVLVIHLECGS
jgi:hypothetical protein